MKKSKRSSKTLYVYGKKIEQLGKALQRKDSNMTELGLMAEDCGLELQFRFFPESRSSVDAG